MSNDKMREGFEAEYYEDWLGGGDLFKRNKLKRGPGGSYVDPETAAAWWGYQQSQQPESEPVALMDDDSPAKAVGEIGNQIHNLGCEYQNDEELSDRLAEIAHSTWKLQRDLIRSPQPTPQVQDEVETLSRSDREWLEGMEVSVDVSTGEHDASHRLFGTVCEVMDNPGSRHGVILLVADAESNGDYTIPQPTPQLPEGWKLVPVDPTQAMWEAGDGAFEPSYTGTPVATPHEIYKAMLTASPEPPVNGGE